VCIFLINLIFLDGILVDLKFNNNPFAENLLLIEKKKINDKPNQLNLIH
jgi:hypothetical protein